LIYLVSIARFIYHKNEVVILIEVDMPRVNNLIKGPLAKELIEELGGMCEAARICDIASSSVASWSKIGVPRARVMYLKLKFPKLNVWKKVHEEI
jgi:hypothetical protein